MAAGSRTLCLLLEGSGCAVRMPETRFWQSLWPRPSTADRELPTQWARQPVRLARSPGLAKGEDLARYEVFLVLDGSPAAEAGLQAGDVVVELDGVPASSLPLTELRRRCQAKGTTRRIVLERDGKRRSVDLKLRRLI